MNPVRTTKNALTPKPIKKVRRAMHPIDNAVYSMQRPIVRQLVVASRERARRTGTAVAP